MKNLTLFIFLLSQACLTAQAIEPAPPDKAVVYFVRADIMGPPDQFALFDGDKLISLINVRDYVRYECDPGKHLFWAKSENVDYVKADFQAGNIYIIQVIPDIGIGSPRVNLYPIDSLSDRTDRIKKLIVKKDAHIMDEEKRVKLQKQLQRTIVRCLKKAKRKDEMLVSHSGFSIVPENF